MVNWLNDRLFEGLSWALTGCFRGFLHVLVSGRVSSQWNVRSGVLVNLRLPLLWLVNEGLNVIITSGGNGEAVWKLALLVEVNL